MKIFAENYHLEQYILGTMKSRSKEVKSERKA